MRELRLEKAIDRKELVLSPADEARIDNVLQTALDLSPKGLAVLRDRIKKNNGLIRIFVHPFYRAESREKIPVDNQLKHARKFVENGAERHFGSAARSNTAPLFLFEEREFLEDAGERIRNHGGDLSAGVYVIPTEESSGRTDEEFLKKTLRGTDWHAEEQKEAIAEINEKVNKSRDFLKKFASSADLKSMIAVTEQKLIDPAYAEPDRAADHFEAILLKGLGVKKVLIGGMYLRNNKEGLEGCVARIIEASKKLGILVALSKYHIDWFGENTSGQQQGKNRS